MATGSSYQPPKRFTFSRPEGWPSWIKRFKRHRIASSLDLKDEERQEVSSLVYSMGEEAEDILESFRLFNDEHKSYETIRDEFESFFVKRNVIFDRISFF